MSITARPRRLNRCGQPTPPTSECLAGATPPNHSHGRLLSIHTRPQTSEGHDRPLPHRSDIRCCGQDGYGSGSRHRQDGPAQRQRSGLRVQDLQGLLMHGGHQAHLRQSLPSTDQGKLERYHQTLKRDVNHLPYEMPSASELEVDMVAFVSYYNYRRYHKAPGDVMPSDVLRGRREAILR